MVSMAALTTSNGPTETPPATMSRSAPSARPRRRRVRTSSRTSVAMPRSMTSAPARVARARRPGPFASGMPAGPSISPGARTSSPVARTATRGRRCTSIASTPAPASKAMVAAPIAVPGSTSVVPSTRSLPVARIGPAGSDHLVHVDGRRERARRIPSARAGLAVSVQGRRRLDRDHRVRAVGEPCAGGDPDRRPGPDDDVGREARPHLADHLQPGRDGPVRGRRRCPRPGSRSRPSPSSARAATRSGRQPPRRPRDRAQHRSRPVPCRSAGRRRGPRPGPSRR